MYFQQTSLDAAERFFPKLNHASNNMMSLQDSHALVFEAADFLK
jgi:ribulose kinase